MPLPLAVPLAIAAVGIISAAGSYFSNKSAIERAAMVQDRAFKQFMELNIPDPEEQKIALQKFVSQGELVPKFQQAIAQNPSEFQKIVTDPSNKVAQSRALQELESVGYSGGLRLQDKAALQEATLNSQAQERANREGISADMARRGLGGSGYDVQARLQGQQGVADRNASDSLKVAAGAQDRALSAIMGSGDLASKYRTQDFGEQAQKATSADRINAFNTQNLRDVNAANTGIQNATADRNLNERQKLSDQNTALTNSQEVYNKGLQQQQFDNQLKKVGGATGQLNAIAQTEQRGGQIMGNAFTNVGTGVIGGLSSAAQYDLMDQYLKKKNG